MEVDMDIDAGLQSAGRTSRTRAALVLGFALALVAGLGASVLRVSDATTVACYAALANDLSPILGATVAGDAGENAACPSVSPS